MKTFLFIILTLFSASAFSAKPTIVNIKEVGKPNLQCVKYSTYSVTCNWDAYNKELHVMKTAKMREIELYAIMMSLAKITGGIPQPDEQQVESFEESLSNEAWDYVPLCGEEDLHAEDLIWLY